MTGESCKLIMEENSATLRGLDEAIKAAFSHRLESPEPRQAWERACAEFHARHDDLAFPGGISSAIERIAAGDMSTVETAIICLELHPYFFRSQYHATTFTRLLKKLQLSADLQQRFDAFLAAARERRLRRTGGAQHGPHAK